MTPNFHSPMSPTFPVHDHQDHDQHHQLFVFQSQSQSASSSSFPPPPGFFDQGGFYHREQSHNHLLHHQEEAKVYASQGGSCDHNQTVRNESDCTGLKLTLWKKEERNENQSENSSAKWMSSKMRLMKKMIMNSEGGPPAPADRPNNLTPKFEDQKPFSSTSEAENSCNKNSYNINNNTNTIRVCADCNTTKTPLWRSGPRGPKSLCNACGIRQRKARRAAMAAAAAAAANGTILAADAPRLTKKSKVQRKDKATSHNNSCLPFKKRCKMASPIPAKTKKKQQQQLGFDDLTIILSKNSRVFPQDEKEAAILLMALSHGLLHG